MKKITLKRVGQAIAAAVVFLGIYADVIPSLLYYAFRGLSIEVYGKERLGNS